MIVGFTAGIIRMILDFYYRAPPCGEPDNRPSFVKDIHFFYVALILFLLTGIVCVIVSLLTDPPDDELVRHYTKILLVDNHPKAHVYCTESKIYFIHHRPILKTLFNLVCKINNKKRTWIENSPVCLLLFVMVFPICKVQV